MRRWLMLIAVAVMCGCRAPERDTASPRATKPAPPPTAVVFVANGAGGGRTFSHNLIAVIEDTGSPVEVEVVEWSHGRGRLFADELDRDNHLEQGRRLAAQVQAYHRAFPDRRICLAGHSAGCAIVLIAAEHLPENVVERIILLSPSVCPSYDLRPALHVARAGIDNFHSGKDRLILGLGMRIVGTTDGCSVAAGQHGFEPVGNSPADAAAYAKLRQHPWDSAIQWAGHDGGHMGDTNPRYLRTYVLPLLVEAK